MRWVCSKQLGSAVADIAIVIYYGLLAHMALPIHPSPVAVSTLAVVGHSADMHRKVDGAVAAASMDWARSHCEAVTVTAAARMAGSLTVVARYQEVPDCNETARCR